MSHIALLLIYEKLLKFQAMDQESQIEKINIQSSDGFTLAIDAQLAEKFRSKNRILLQMSKENTFTLTEVDGETLTMVIWVVKRGIEN